jgi:hypothetical protein
MTSNERVVMCVTLTLCIVIAGMVMALVMAVFDPVIPNEPIFAIIGPAFQTVIGGFIGLITGIKIGQQGKEEKDAE